MSRILVSVPYFRRTMSSTGSAASLGLAEDPLESSMFLKDPLFTYRLAGDQSSPSLFLERRRQRWEGDVQEEGSITASTSTSLTVESIMSSLLSHLLTICELLPDTESGGDSGGAAGARQNDFGPMYTFALSIIQQILAFCITRNEEACPDHLPIIQRQAIIFIYACLESSPLETIAACRHLRLWQTLLSAVGMPGNRRQNTLLAQTLRDQCSCSSSSSDSDPSTTHVYSITPTSPSAYPFWAWLRVQDLSLELIHR